MILMEGLAFNVRNHLLISRYLAISCSSLYFCNTYQEESAGDSVLFEDAFFDAQSRISQVNVNRPRDALESMNRPVSLSPRPLPRAETVDDGEFFEPQSHFSNSGPEVDLLSSRHPLASASSRPLSRVPSNSSNASLLFFDAQSNDEASAASIPLDVEVASKTVNRFRITRYRLRLEPFNVSLRTTFCSDVDPAVQISNAARDLHFLVIPPFTLSFEMESALPSAPLIYMEFLTAAKQLKPRGSHLHLFFEPIQLTLSQRQVFSGFTYLIGIVK